MHPPQLLSKAQFVRQLRIRLESHLYDESAGPPEGVAIYSLSDPRDVREIRYIGQTMAPRRRLLQHVGTARLWLPDERPWWVKSTQLRPLYDWIRQLYRDEARLPVMVVSAWTDVGHAKDLERERIHECLQRKLPILNYERELLGAQRKLLCDVSKRRSVHQPMSEIATPATRSTK
jgi:hypothetical protein